MWPFLPIVLVLPEMMANVIVLILFAHILLIRMQHAMRKVSVDNVLVILRGTVIIIINVHQGWRPLIGLLIHRILHVIAVRILVVLGLVRFHLRHLGRQLAVHGGEEGATTLDRYTVVVFVRWIVFMR